MDRSDGRAVRGDLAAAVRYLAAATHHTRPDDVPEVANRAGRLCGAADVRLYLVDYGQEQLKPFGADADALTLDTTVAGRAFTLVRPQVSGDVAGGHQVWLPLLDGADRLGVARFATLSEPTPQLLESFTVIASLLGGLVASRRHYGDAIERTRRNEPMQLAAEIVWSMLPPLTFTGPAVSIAAILEPCYEVGGDTFDYAVNTDAVHLAIFDAVGHGIEASALSALALNAYRNARRTGLDLLDCYRSVDRWISARFPDAFVTTIMAQLDTNDGVLRYIDAAHPAALLIREGTRPRPLAAPTAAACGLQSFVGRTPRVAEEHLQPGDHVLLYTDGVVEARSEGQFFGLPRLTDLTVKAIADGLPVPETLRRLRRAVLEHQQSVLQDDATAMLLRWRP